MIKRIQVSSGIICFGLIVLSLSILSCGKKGSPKPPEELAPSPIGAFAAAGAVHGVMLSWQAPTTDSNGDPLLNLSGFRVKRAFYVPDEDLDFTVVAEINVNADGVAAYTYTDADVAPGKSYEYAVVGVNDDAVEGRAPYNLRVRFTGESSSVETIM